ncbi:hypothetical protein NHQ30_006267 [Ciborinia camelliae]|nr:hypothetical protein NHQ30_006267 [Ciborinia camelliae]
MSETKTKTVVEWLAEDADNATSIYWGRESAAWRLWESGVLMIAIDYASCHGHEFYFWATVEEVVKGVMPWLRNQEVDDRRSLRFKKNGEDSALWTGSSCLNRWVVIKNQEETFFAAVRHTLDAWVFPRLIEAEPSNEEPIEAPGIYELVRLVNQQHKLPGEKGFPRELQVVKREVKWTNKLITLRRWNLFQGGDEKFCGGCKDENGNQLKVRSWQRHPVEFWKSCDHKNFLSKINDGKCDPFDDANLPTEEELEAHKDKAVKKSWTSP